MNEKYRIISISLKNVIVSELNLWCYGKDSMRKNISDSHTITTTLNPTIIEIIDSITTNRSEFVRNCILEHLANLNSVFKEPFTLYNSKGSFIRGSIICNIIPKGNINNVDVVDQKQNFWIKYNGKLMKRDDFINKMNGVDKHKTK